LKILIAGGSGMIGRQLSALLIDGGDQVIILSRTPSKVKGMPTGVEVFPWDGKTIQDWVQQVDYSDAIINLAGENLSGYRFPPSRWTEKRKNLLRNSRLEAGNVLTKAVKMAGKKPSVFIQASGISYYGTKQERALTEADPPGNDFLANLAIDWETSSSQIAEQSVRYVIIRNGVVLSVSGGALPYLLLPYKLWVGGRLGNGKQVLSWIHLIDEARAIQFLVHNPTASGVFNLTSPNPMTDDEFGKTIGKVMHRPHYFPVPGFAMKLALGEVSMMVLEGQRVLPKRLVELGFQYNFPVLDDALVDLLNK
jgi:uncharacterized protein (TIGR01777 family)